VFVVDVGRIALESSVDMSELPQIWDPAAALFPAEMGRIALESSVDSDLKVVRVARRRSQ
jgi:hypothetical protein